MGSSPARTGSPSNESANPLAASISSRVTPNIPTPMTVQMMAGLNRSGAFRTASGAKTKAATKQNKMEALPPNIAPS